MSESPPEIPGYRYIEPLPQQGGYSTVYRYEQDTPRRPVAVKVLKDRGVGAAVLREMVAEANAMARLGNHPNIVQVLEAKMSANQQPYIVMPYCSGPNLWQLISGGVLDVRKVVWVGVHIAGAVHAAHRADLVHRDIKPANILTDEFGNPRLTDFGIAGKLVRTNDSATEKFGLSLPWCPPEILTGDSGTVASDVYSLGATLWHMLAGHSPFDVVGDNSAVALEWRIANTPAPWTGRSDVPRGLEGLLAEMLAKRPGQRPASADVVAARLRSIEIELGGPVAPDAPWYIDAVRGGTRTVNPELDGTVDRPPGGPAAQQGRPTVKPATDRLHLPPPAPEFTVIRPRPDVVEPVPAADAEAPTGTRTAWWVWAAAVAVVAIAGGITVLMGLGKQSTVASQAGAMVESGAGTQDAGAMGDNVPPGVPVVTATRLNAATLRFAWTYSAPLDSDTFSWRTVDGTRSGTAPSASTDVADPAGTQLCVQVKVVRADGSYASVDWSPQGCGS